MKYDRFALIPAYCPEECLIDIAAELRNRGFIVIVVNDGSGSDYRHIFDSLAGIADVLVHIKNHGKGAALRTGLKYILENYQPPYAVVTLDADGQHSIDDAERVIKKACEQPDSLILGSRSFKGKVPLRSILGNNITKMVFRIASGVNVRDTQTGLRAFTDSHIEKLLSVSGDRYEYEMNVLMRYAKEKIRIEEVPIDTIYIGKNESSHFDPIHDSYRIYKEILKFSASSLLCFGIDYALFCLYSSASGSVAAANISARVFSSAANYDINRRFVFDSKKDVRQSACQYFMLAALILTLNTLLLNAIVLMTPLNRYTAKLITEATMFIVSWTIQHSVIFKKNGGSIND